MARFFVSYSRSIKEDVKQIVQVLRDNGHEVWWDQDIPSSADWWGTILDNIEWCEVFIFIASEYSVESIYCKAELKYASNRQQPILPLIFDKPETLNLPPQLPQRTQWLIYDGIPENILGEINKAYFKIDWDKHQTIDIVRPNDPNTENNNADQFEMAVDAAKKKKFEKARNLFNSVKYGDYDNLGEACDKWLRRIASYEHIIVLWQNEETRDRAKEAWKIHTEKYGREFNPYRINLEYQYMYILIGVIAIITLGGLWGWNLAFSPQHISLEITDTPTLTNTSILQATDTSIPTNTSVPQATDTPIPTNTSVPQTTDTSIPTNTSVPQTTDTSIPTNTSVPQTTDTSIPTNTSVPQTTDTSIPTNTSVPQTTDTPIPINNILTLAKEGVSHNNDWIVYKQRIGDMDMVLVPAGCFVIGSNDEQVRYAIDILESTDEAIANETGGTKICVESFWISQTEITRAQFEACINANACEKPQDSLYSTEAQHPINLVTWFQASAYCEWRAMRLPNEDEWEFAARGPDGLIYPWSNNYISENVVGSMSSVEFVGNRSSGSSWVGAFDMSGNVWEWTNSIYEDYPYDPNDGREDDTGFRTDVQRVLRGGGFSDTPFYLRTTVRSKQNTNYAYSLNGFRCVRS